MDFNINFSNSKFLIITATSQSVGEEMTSWSKGIKTGSRNVLDKCKENEKTILKCAACHLNRGM